MLTDAALARLSARVGRHLSQKGWLMATAESSTGGFIAKAVTDVSGSSTWFSEGWVTYSNASKTARLGVTKRVLRQWGAVSEPVARAMAEGALRRAGAQVAVAVTGVAGPDGGSAEKPVGTVWIAWAARAGRSVRIRTAHHRLSGNRDQVRRKTVGLALQGLLH
jgi:nicotinamide-nucleotide amidase